MHKIDTNTATANGEFTDGDSSAAIEATDLNAAWFNTIQRELINLVQGTNQTLSAVDDSQIFKAVKKLGFQAFQVDNGTFDSAANNAGNIAIVCEPENLTITGTMQTGKVVFVIPLWSDTSASSIRVNYKNHYISIAKGNALFGFVSNGYFVYDDDLIGFQFPIAVGGKFIASNIETGRIKASSIVAPELVKVLWDPSGVKSIDWLEFSNWEIGQVKRIYTVSGGTAENTTIVQIYAADGSTIDVSFHKNSYREFICVGSVTVGNVVYAVLKHNGYNTGDAY